MTREIGPTAGCEPGGSCPECNPRVEWGVCCCCDDALTEDTRTEWRGKDYCLPCAAERVATINEDSATLSIAQLDEAADILRARADAIRYVATRRHKAYMAEPIRAAIYAACRPGR